jgi:hypothetical protein
MGMDLSGVKPTNPKGEYFQASVWTWRPLAELCLTLAPQECACVQEGTDIDPTPFGWGSTLDAEQATSLGNKLLELIADGSVAAYLQISEVEIEQSGLRDPTAALLQNIGVKFERCGPLLELERVQAERDEDDRRTSRCEHDHRYATKIMTEMGDIDIPASIAYFEEHGGYCDCEIGFNVDPEVSKH